MRIRMRNNGIAPLGLENQHIYNLSIVTIYLPALLYTNSKIKSDSVMNVLPLVQILQTAIYSFNISNKYSWLAMLEYIYS